MNISNLLRLSGMITSTAVVADDHATAGPKDQSKSGLAHRRQRRKMM